MQLMESGEMYLETILVLSQTKKTVRAIDVSEYMGFSKPSVSRAVNNLKSAGYIKVAEDGGITLTADGKKTAEKIYERHKVLTQILVELGVPERLASEDACKIEHDISDETFAAVKKHLKATGS
ncbi:MAG: metal-dependent transcriptional regulator [Lachnospiraceae bacterium]|nr:metal-dependent transcriptional regulator [Candidatus Minthocola equi]